MGYRGFINFSDIDSLIRAVRHDHGTRLYEEHLVSQGKLKQEHSSTWRDLHRAILMQNDYTKPFNSNAELWTFVYRWVAKMPRKDYGEHRVILQNLHRGLGMPPRGVLEVTGWMSPWEPKSPGGYAPEFECLG